MQTTHRPFDADTYHVRCATVSDAAELARLRVQLDAETEHFDRFPGEAVLDEETFRTILTGSSTVPDRILVVERSGQLVAYSRCTGFSLRRFAHKAEFGIGVQKDHWGQGIGNQLLTQTIDWVKTSQLKKIQLSVIETNHGAIRLYQRHGFQEEGRLRHDRLLQDGCYYDTVLMGLQLI
ncbi:GNAT family N-acetyltransferase [Exiguobacterium sp. S22-S28]|uniref:GNAT family N-acetyltransferase n=1 Tax=Exiguobacterium sp. S22-S28 TaxID=3342768 RepID=UPI00372D49B4